MDKNYQWEKNFIINHSNFLIFRVPAIPKRPAVNTKSSRTPNLVVKRKLNDDEPSQEAKKPMIEENPSELNASDDLGQLFLYSVILHLMNLEKKEMLYEN